MPTLRTIICATLLACPPWAVGAAEGVDLFSADRGAVALRPPAQSPLHERASPMDGLPAGALREFVPSPELRSRSARMDLGRLAQARTDVERGSPSRLSLNLFADAEFEAVIERTAPTASGYTLAGRLADEPLSMVVVAVNGEHVAGTVWSSRGVHSIRATGTAAVVRQLDPAARRRCEVGEASAPKAAAAPGDARRADDAHPADDGGEIDVLVVYSAQARKSEGGHRAMRALIDQEVLMVNEAYQASGAMQRIRLVAAVETDLPTSVAWEDPQGVVGKLASKSDGHMDEVHALRDSYAADLVALHLGSDLVTFPSGAVRASLLASDFSDASTAAFSVSSLGLLAHELGHNMGLHHNREEVYGGFAGPPVPLNLLYPYSYGYNADDPSSPNGPGWATIMSYNGLPIPRFSNPRQKYPDESGVPLGVPGEEWNTAVDGPADAVRSLNNTRRLVANHRASAARCTYALSPPPPAVPASGGEYLVRVEAPPGCAWTAREDGDGFAEVTAGGSGVGDGEVAYRVLANGGLEREAAVLVAGEVYPAVQAAARVRVVKPVCERSPLVQHAIRRTLPSWPGSCRNVTDADLAGIRALEIHGWGCEDERGVRLEPEDFAGLYNLSSLAVSSGCEYRGDIMLELGAFAGLSNLVRMDLLGSVAAWEPGVFAGLSNLKKLYVHAFNVTLLRRGMFEGLPNLVSLVLGDNDNKLASLALVDPTVFEGLSGLKILYLGRHGLTALGPGVFEGLPNLASLDLNDNKLASLDPGAFEGLEDLQILRLQGNRLANLRPGSFGALPNLEFLDLSRNGLASLDPGVFDGLSDLKTLHLDDNRLTNLQLGLFGSLPYLRFLTLRGNDLASLEPGVFDGIMDLHGLFLEDNRLTTLKKGVLGPWRFLRHLFLDGNGLNALDRSLFSGSAPAIERLHLGRNNLRTLEGGLAGLLREFERFGQSSLVSLRLDANQLETLPPGLFEGLSKLRQLDLRRNSGAPFTLTAELVALPASGDAAGRPDVVAVEVAEGAPFDMAVGLSASGARLAAEEVVIPKGRTRSELVSVAPLGAAPAAIRLALAHEASASPSCSESDWRAVSTICYGGIRVVAGPPLVLYGLADQALAAGGTIKFHLASVFPNFPDGMAYMVELSDPTVAEAAVSGGLLIVAATGGGETEVAVTATGPDGLSATLAFTVTVKRPVASRWGGWRSALLRPPPADDGDES